MNYVTIPNTDIKVSQQILGTMRLITKGVTPEGKKTYVSVPVEEAEALMKRALELGINFLDTADIYGHGLAEEVVGNVFERNPGMRDQFFVQTKFAVVSGPEGRCNSADGAYIRECVDGSLKRLKTDHIDSLLIHMPDPLFDPKEVADVFDELYKEGKVRFFGVSNWTSGNIALLQQYMKQPVTFDQEQFSLVHANMIDSEMAVNQNWELSVQKDTEKRSFLRRNNIQLQAYSSIMAEAGEGTFINNPKYEKTNALLDKLCEKYHTNKNAIALAWIHRLPEGIQTVIGTTKVSRLEDSAKACDVTLTRQEWYDLYLSVGRPIL